MFKLLETTVLLVIMSVKYCGSCQQGLIFIVVRGLLIALASLVWKMGSGREGFGSCGTWAQQLWLVGSRVQAPQLWHTGLVALQHVGSSQTRARTRVPCIGRQILNHCATKEAPSLLLKIRFPDTFSCCIFFAALSFFFVSLTKKVTPKRSGDVEKHKEKYNTLLL